MLYNKPEDVRGFLLRELSSYRESTVKNEAVRTLLRTPFCTFVVHVVVDIAVHVVRASAPARIPRALRVAGILGGWFPVSVSGRWSSQMMVELRVDGVKWWWESSVRRVSFSKKTS